MTLNETLEYFDFDDHIVCKDLVLIDDGVDAWVGFRDVIESACEEFEPPAGEDCDDEDAREIYTGWCDLIEPTIGTTSRMRDHPELFELAKKILEEEELSMYPDIIDQAKAYIAEGSVDEAEIRLRREARLEKDQD